MALSAVIMPVAAAAAAVDRFRLEHTDAGAAGMPAHVTLLVPFTEDEPLSARRIGVLREVLEAVEPFDVRLETTAFFDSTPRVLYLEPRPKDRFLAIIHALVEAFPEHPPYGDPNLKPVPHVTVAVADDEILAHAEAEIRGALPIGARAEEAWLVEKPAARWLLRERIRFSGAVASAADQSPWG